MDKLEVVIILMTSLIKVCVPSKPENLNLRFESLHYFFNMITRINVSNTLTKHIPCKCQYNFDGRKCNSNQKWNNNKCWSECKNKKKNIVCEKSKKLI